MDQINQEDQGEYDWINSAVMEVANIGATAFIIGSRLIEGVGQIVSQLSQFEQINREEKPDQAQEVEEIYQSETITYNFRPSEQSATSCTICLERYVRDESVSLLPCFHLYHEQCIKDWLQRRQECPVCKRKV